ncbi:MAG: hypothetical protein Greene071436_121 [Parcubacteria group bacterium Greene0714_36]|nr:MAG: hypothetical protein Greene071436_121 [Parcubacteria group bacterium Greene0714_36]
MMQGNEGGMCRCQRHSMMPVFAIAFGLVFLLGAMDVLAARVVSIAWPIIVIAAGVTKLTRKMCSCCGMHAQKMQGM